ncbi:MAG: ornithine cyclodeaminase family protein [Terricaulis sp.]
MSTRTILLNRGDIAALMSPADYLTAVENAFRASGQGNTSSPSPMHIPTNGGGFHAKGAALKCDGHSYVALKLNGNFPGNPDRGLPTIQGAILLCDADNGRVLAILDSIEITLRRTAAASALAARHLARSDAKTLAIFGCGAQARAQAEALAEITPFERALVWDLDATKAKQFAHDMGDALGFAFEVAPNARSAARAADVIVTCTTARTPFLAEADVPPGAFIAAVGADHPQKSEIAPALMAKAVVVVDNLDQCLHMGDLHHAVEAGAMRPGDVHAALADIVTGARPGRSRRDAITIFDSTGTAIQDVASAALVYERAQERGAGLPFTLA